MRLLTGESGHDDSWEWEKEIFLPKAQGTVRPTTT
ncbi:hypothetical protein DYST_02222 [Dyella terrae]|nr:hypothetical protein DYST_02222 [Dyella terrae]